MVTDEDVRRADDDVEKARDNARRVREQAVDERYDAAATARRQAEELE